MDVLSCVKSDILGVTNFLLGVSEKASEIDVSKSTDNMFLLSENR